VPSTTDCASSDRRRLRVRPAEQGESPIEIQLQTFSKDAFRLFDEDPAVQRVLQPIRQGVTTTDRALPQQPDRGDVSEGLARTDLVLVQRPGLDAEDMWRAQYAGAPGTAAGASTRTTRLMSHRSAAQLDAGSPAGGR
jgi:hypothetical protein